METSDQPAAGQQSLQFKLMLLHTFQLVSFRRGEKLKQYILFKILKQFGPVFVVLVVLHTETSKTLTSV